MDSNRMKVYMFASLPQLSFDGRFLIFFTKGAGAESEAVVVVVVGVAIVAVVAAVVVVVEKRVRVVTRS